MSGMKVNFGEVEGSFEPLPEAEYESVIERVEVRQAEDKEYPYLNFECKALEDDYEDRRIWVAGSLSPGGLIFTKNKLIALGVIEEDDEIEFEWEDDVDPGPADGPTLTNPELEGMACTIRTSNEVRDGQERQSAWRSEFVEGSASPPKKSSVRKSSSKSTSANGKGKAGAKKSGGRSRSLR